MKPKSQIRIAVKCDYCGKICYPKYVDYLNGHKEINKDSCCDCKHLKTQEIYLLKYGTTSLKVRSEIEGFKIGRNKTDGKIVYNVFINKGVIPQFKPEDYIGAFQDLPYICEKHMEKGILYRSYDTIRDIDCACKFCNIELGRNFTRYSQEFVNEKFLEKQYKLITQIYEHVDQELEFICERHPEESIQTTTFWSVLQYTNNCKRCRYDMQSGEFHYNWQGGISSERDEFKASGEYQRWRKAVFERDNYTCQCCGKTNTYLQAHHKYNYSTYLDLRLDINNGITLCEDCHSINKLGSFHNIYTQFNNSPEELKEYIQRYKNGEFNELRKFNLVS